MFEASLSKEERQKALTTISCLFKNGNIYVQEN